MGFEYAMNFEVVLIVNFRGVQVLAEPADLDKYIAEEEVLYLLLHSPSDTEILVRLIYL